jgi:hypothetical protein
MQQPDRKSLTFKQLTRGAYLYAAPLPARGFAWREDLELLPRERYSPEAKTGPWLVGPMRDGFREPQASPLQPRQGDPGIHRRIAALWSPESIATFADEYGHLLPDDEMAALDEEPEPSGLSFKVELYLLGESLAQWRREIARFRRLLHFWDLVQSGNEKQLGQFIVWRSQDVTLRWIDTPGGPEPAPRRAPWPNDISRFPIADVTSRHLLDRWKHTDVIEPVRYYLHLEVSDGLRGVSPHVLPYAPASHRIAFIPDSLRAAAFVLFALELAGETTTAICENFPHCPRPGGRFVPQTRRGTFCSDYCRRAKWERDNRARRREEASHGEA